MTQKIPFDPFTMWKDMYEHTEKAWSDIIQDTLGKESFSEGLGQVQLSYLQYQEMMNNLTEMYFKQINIPTRDEIANVASLVINIENKIDAIEDQLDENGSDMTTEINQLKRTVHTLEKKLDKILDALSLLDEKIVTATPPQTIAAETNIAPKPVTETKVTPKPTNSNNKK